MTLVDTGPLVALCDARDSHHRRAIKHLTALAGRPLITCEAVMTEACFHLESRPARLRLAALIDELQIDVIAAAADPEEREVIFAWLDRYAEHEPDWADACLACLSVRGHDVWTYDREFETTWRQPSGGRIRLAIERR